MMLSSFLYIYIYFAHVRDLRWVKWRGWWQTKSNLKGCLMKRTRQTARPVCTLSRCLRFVSHQMIGPWEMALSNRACLATPVADEHPSVLARHCLWVFKWFHQISKYTSYVKTQLIDHGWSHQLVLMLCDVLYYGIISLKLRFHFICTYMTCWISVKWFIICQRQANSALLLLLLPSSLRQHIWIAYMWI